MADPAVPARRVAAAAGRPKLCFFVTEDWYFVSHRLPLAIAAKQAGYEVCVATRVRKHGDVIRAAGLRLLPFENSRGGLNPLAELFTLIRLILLWRREQPDVVHHVAMKPVLYGSIAARLANTPNVINALAGLGWLVSSRKGLVGWLKPAVCWILGSLLRTGVVIVQNPDDARFLGQLGVPDWRIRRIPGSGVDLSKFVPRPQPPGPVVVVLPARLLWDKGVGEFVGAARELLARGVRARFVLAGAPDPANPSAVPPQRIQQWVAEGIVAAPGWIEDMPALLASSSIVCLPSFYGEGIPKSLIEAAAAGLPIVTTDTPGCREIVHTEDNGILVPPRDERALAQALERLIGDPELRARMGSRGRARAEREFSLETVIEQTVALYRQPLRPTPSPTP
jgi:glycosyltransferase involved in cell wall biosynthesis